MSLITDLISYWKLQDNSNDEIEVNNGADTDIVYSEANGKIDKGAGFNGGTSIINHGATNFPTGGNPRTFNFWFNAKDFLAGGSFLFFYGQATAQHMQMMYVTANDAFYNGHSNDYNENFSFSVDTWYMVTYTFDGTTAKIYVNGNLLGAGSNRSDWATQAGAGSFGNNASGQINGAMDEIGVWSRVLDSDEISALYNGGDGLQYPFGVSDINGNFLGFF